MVKLAYCLQARKFYFLRYELEVGIECSWPPWRYIMIHTKQICAALKCPQPCSLCQVLPQSGAPCIRCSLSQVLLCFLMAKLFSSFLSLFLPVGSVGSQVPEDGRFAGRLRSWLADLL